jgi:hypothetical protein
MNKELTGMMLAMLSGAASGGSEKDVSDKKVFKIL